MVRPRRPGADSIPRRILRVAQRLRADATTSLHPRRPRHGGHHKVRHRYSGGEVRAAAHPELREDLLDVQRDDASGVRALTGRRPGVRRVPTRRVDGIQTRC